MTCLSCPKELGPNKQRRHAKFCSKMCRKLHQRSKWKAVNPRPVDLSRSSVGTIAELLVAIDLLKQGFDVFRAVSPSAACDLAIVKDHRLIRVEVKTTYRTLSGRLYHPQTKAHAYDLLALMVNYQDIVYVPPLDQLIADKDD